MAAGPFPQKFKLKGTNCFPLWPFNMPIMTQTLKGHTSEAVSLFELKFFFSGPIVFRQALSIPTLKFFLNPKLSFTKTRTGNRYQARSNFDVTSFPLPSLLESIAT
jgi:hypothetical protein